VIEALRHVLGGALERLSHLIKTDLPPLIAALAILAVAFLLAKLIRWLVTRVFKGMEADQWLRRSGIGAMIDRSGSLRASRLVAHGAYWGVLMVGFLGAMSAFGTQFSTRIAEGIVLLLPRLLAGGLIVLAGTWLGQYLGRSTLVWAVNEDLPSPRRLALGVRALVVFAAVAAAADTVGFARSVFLAAFILIVGGAMLAAGLALGLGARDAVRRRLAERFAEDRAPDQDQLGERSLWNHL
jgi:hypothetical protein